MKALEWKWSVNLPLVKNKHITKWVHLGCCTIEGFYVRGANSTYHLFLFGWCVLTVNRNEYHDRSDAERADEYLAAWSKCEKRMRRAEMLLYGQSLNEETRRLLKEGLGGDYDNGSISGEKLCPHCKGSGINTP